MPPRKRRTVYPPPRNATRPPRPGEPGGPGGPPVGEPYVRPTVASINLSASTGRAGLKIGDRVRINGTGLYSGEFATIEKLTTGAIPSAVVRTEAGRTRQVRTIDLEPATATPSPAVAPAAAAAQPAPAPQPALAAPAASAEPEPGDGPEPSEG